MAKRKTVRRKTPRRKATPVVQPVYPPLVVQQQRAAAPWWAPYVTLVAIVAIVAGAYATGTPTDDSKPIKPVADLAALIPDATDRAKLAAYFGDFAAVVRDDSRPLKTTGDFRDALRRSADVLESADRLPNYSPLNEPVSKRIEAAIGLSDQPLDGDPPLRSNLAIALDSISQDLGD